jgi:hypothetical protein
MNWLLSERYITVKRKNVRDYRYGGAICLVVAGKLSGGRRQAGGGSGQPIFQAGHFIGMRVPFVTLRLI